MSLLDRKKVRAKKKLRIKAKVSGTSEKPRLSVFKSLNNIFVQLIDDSKGVTLLSSSTIAKDLKGKKLNSNIPSAVVIGKDIGSKALKKGYKKVVFDRGGYIYTGVIKALADAAREAGLDF